jgi:hypothetical protein
MATNTGPDSNSYQIPEVELGDTFNTWRDITNTSVYKINKIRVYDGVSSSELNATVSAGGTLTYVLADNIPNGHTFQGVIVFDSGVTFNGNVTFNAQTFTVNANNVTIDDYAIVLGATAGVTDTNINSAGGGGIILTRGGGKTAEWLWLPTDLQGGSGSWLSNSHIGFSGITWGLYPYAGTTLPVYGTGFRVQGGNTADHGVEIALSSVTGRTANRSITFSRYSPSGSTAFIDVLSGSTYGSEAFVRIREGANRKVITYGGSPGFPFGTPVRLDSVANAYAAAQASSGTNAEVIGIVSATATTMGTDRYEITMLGEIHGDFRSVTENGSSLVAGRTYYLSPYNEGKITEIQPTVPGQVHKAVLIATGASAAMVLPFTGGELGTPINIANSTSITTRINQLHKFDLGDSVRFKAYSGGVTLTYSDGAGGTAEANYAQGIYVKAQANTPDEAEIAGMVVGRGGVTGGPGAPVPIYSYFDVMIDGFFDISGTPYTALTPGDVYYLSVNCAGTSGAFESGTTPFNTSVPNLAGQVRKPLFMATSSSGGYLFSYRGDVRSETSITGSSADVEQFLVDDIRSGFSGDLKIGVYDGSSRGRESIRIAAGSVFASSRGVTGYVGIGPSSTWSTWNSGSNTQNRIIAPLDVYGYVRMGVTVDTSVPSGRVLMASRYRGDEVSGLTAQSLNVIGTEYDTGNLQINYGVMPSLGARTYASSLPAGSAVRSSLVVGRTSGAGELRFLTNDGVDAALGTAVTMTERFRITGANGHFSGSFGITGGALTITGGALTVTPTLYSDDALTAYGRLTLYTRTSGSGVTVGLRLYDDADTPDFLRFRPISNTQKGFVFSDDGDAGILCIDSINDRVGIGNITPESPLHITATTPDTPGLLIKNGAGGDDQAAGGCLGLRIRAGDGTGSATLLDIQDSLGAVTHFAVRKDGMTLNGRAFTGGFCPQVIRNTSFGGGSSATVVVPGTSSQKWVGLYTRPSYNYNPGDSVVSYFLANSVAEQAGLDTAPVFTGGTSITFGREGIVGSYPSTNWLWSVTVWWWRVS